MELKPFQQRVVDEKKELDVKIDNLKKFIAESPTFKTLPVEEQARMQSQYYAMTRYSDVLGERIAAFDSGGPYLCETNCAGKRNLIWYPYAVLVRSDVADLILNEVRRAGDLSVPARLVALELAAAKYQARTWHERETPRD